jgi:hypothetical protein
MLKRIHILLFDVTFMELDGKIYASVIAPHCSSLKSTYSKESKELQI